MSDGQQAETGGTGNGSGRSDLEGMLERMPTESHARVAEEAAALARAHYEVEPGLRAIYRLEGADPDDLRIKLLEVNEQTVPTGIVPVGFPPHPASGLHYPSVIIEVTPQEFDAIRNRRLDLPAGWEIGGTYERPEGVDHAGGTT